ncbi:kojibiose phosphorylase [Halanaerobium saccharolyticum]|uniref:Kojibiose phosphorylase n=1 Tax=Halanaerobium saccharolyticum TaxID=43595 RepID=A0A4R7Z670_9FIRM|nr:glycosyl hydrolase family 65 protein [Halanaerobium saccharolyticum]RAK10503.1 kojibiose phosphorylase [Halanaerobium saccharolyticum]TDW06740.1 kojibiose phosphorylase [Halanaerobium saccharolyticum]TDX62375.1 kojibiose phosphorylase [Halanaerobium saccharolyticum]
MNHQDFFKVKDGWNLEIESIKEEQLVHFGSNLLCGNGYLGYRGTLDEWNKEQYQACVVTDTYDLADGKWKELSNSPNALTTELKIDGERLGDYPGQNEMTTKLNFNYKYGIFRRKSIADKNIEVVSERFASFDNLHLIANNFQINNIEANEIELKIGINGDVWDLNGTHLENFTGEYNSNKNTLYLKANTVESKITLVTALSFKFKKGKIKNIKVENEEKSIYLLVSVDAESDRIVLARNMIVYSSNDLANPLQAALNDAAAALESSFENLRREHQAVWDKKWELMDIKVRGNLLDQLAVRFNLYHNIIAAPAHSERLPIGARGLSCQAYQGAAFWDQEIFNLPMFLFTETETAKNILKYRYHTLKGARKKAEELGYAGAFYAWISGKTGEELCPSFFFKDVISGRKIRNHFNDWQIHVSPDISYAIWKYYLATEDIDFVINYGSEILFEVARFLHSRVHYNQYQDHYEIIRLLGPDEYHENVDNNAFTNYQTQFALKKALYFYHKMENEYPEKLEMLKEKINLLESEITSWQQIAEKIYLPCPDQDNLIEQFDGYFDLEDTTAEVLEERLINQDEYWGWPNGVAVFTQVIKQADVIQLFTLHDIFSETVLAANYDYYEPRTQHGSSLSPSQYAVVAARLGRAEETYNYFKKSAFIDLMSTNKAVSGGTFIGGIHTAAAGGIWQLIVNGFAGLKIDKEGLSFKPVLCQEWREVEFNLNYRNKKFKVILNKNIFQLKANVENNEILESNVFEKKYMLKPGEEVKIEL